MKRRRATQRPLRITAPPAPAAPRPRLVVVPRPRQPAPRFARLAGGPSAFAFGTPIELVDALADASLEMTPEDLLRVSAALQAAIATHAPQHQLAGDDPISVAGLSGVLADAQRANVLVVTGPTALTIGAVADGQLLKRTGATVVGAAPASGPVTYRSTADYTTTGSAASPPGLNAMACPAGWSLLRFCGLVTPLVAASTPQFRFEPSLGVGNLGTGKRPGYTASSEAYSGFVPSTAQHTAAVDDLSTAVGGADTLYTQYGSTQFHYLIVEMIFNLLAADSVAFLVAADFGQHTVFHRGFSCTVF
jgi:hypothetical protein